MITNEECTLICRCLNDYYEQCNLKCHITVYTENPLQLLLEFDATIDKRITEERRRLMCREIRSLLIMERFWMEEELSCHVFITRAPFAHRMSYCLLVV